MQFLQIRYLTLNGCIHESRERQKEVRMVKKISECNKFPEFDLTAEYWKIENLFSGKECSYK